MKTGVRLLDIPTTGGSQEMLFINEGNLYRLILKSQLPAAEKFEGCVCDEVLPSIRRSGEYHTPSPVGCKRKSLVTVEVMNFLWLIDENLLLGDKKMIALEMGVTEQTIQRVINGQSRNPRVLMALYERALENRLVNNPYSREFIQSALDKLQ